MSLQSRFTDWEAFLSLGVESEKDDRSPDSPIFQSIVAIGSRLNLGRGCALMVLEEDGLRLAADRELTPEDYSTLRLLIGTQEIGFAEDLVRSRGGEMKALVAQGAELVGALVLFRSENVDAASRGDFQEVEWMATVAVEQRHLLNDLSYRAHHDPLTRLWNRLRMDDEIALVTGAGRILGETAALAIVGVDSLRIVNEVLGQEAGNLLLQQVSVRLARAAKPSWSLARVGGDEFALLNPSVSSEDETEEMASRIHDAFEPAFWIGDHELFMRASTGIAIADAATSAEQLQRRASLAFLHAKSKKRGKAATFHPSMAATPPERLAMEQHLRFALQKNELELYYQPQVDLQTGQLIGAEALIRWRHPAMGFIAPSKFIPIAEEIGVIEEIGEWTMDEALRYASAWKAARLGRLRIAVNVSGIQFARPDFGALVARRLHRTDVDPEDLELEITETVMMTNFEHVTRQLRMLRSLGVQIAIDDFGTGHSSLAYLQKLPVHRLKVDRMFVRDITSADENPPLLASIVDMAHAVNLSVIAEGVETREQLAVVARLGCEEMQGYYVSKPISGIDLIELAKNREWKPFGV